MSPRASNEPRPPPTPSSASALAAPPSALDVVPWGDLAHAYGWATDIPGMLRDYPAAAPEQRRELVWLWYGNLYHQGSRYPASVAALPFIIELAAAPELSERHELVRLAISLLLGDPAAFFVSGLRSQAGGDPLLAELIRAYDGCGTVLLGLLDDANARVREAAAAAAAWLLDPAPAARTALLRLLEDEREPSVRFAAMLALSFVARSDDDDLRRCWATARAQPEAAEQLGAALALARVATSDLDDAPLALLLRVASGDDRGLEALEHSTWHEGDLAELCGRVLLRLGEAQRAHSLDALLTALERDALDDGLELAKLVLTLAFDGQPCDGDLATLSTRQRLVLLALLDRTAAWRYANLGGELAALGLPGTREGLCAALGVERALEPIPAHPAFLTHPPTLLPSGEPARDLRVSTVAAPQTSSQALDQWTELDLDRPITHALATADGFVVQAFGAAPQHIVAGRLQALELPPPAYPGARLRVLWDGAQGCLFARELADAWSAWQLAWLGNDDGVVLNGEPLCCALDPEHGRLWIGGRFTRVDGVSRWHLAALSLPELRPLPCAARPEGTVRCLLVEDERIWIGGDFDWIDGRRQPGLAALRLASEGTTEAHGPVLDGAVHALAQWGTGAARRLAVAGRFTRLREPERTLRRPGLALIEPGSGRVADWDAQLEPEGGSAVALDHFVATEHALWVGGNLRGAAGAVCPRIAAFDPRDARLLPYPRPHGLCAVHGLRRKGRAAEALVELELAGAAAGPRTHVGLLTLDMNETS